MGRNSASAPAPVACTLVVAFWVAGVGLAQASLGGELGDGLRRVEDAIEQQLREAPDADHAAPPPHAEPDLIEPWELVGV